MLTAGRNTVEVAGGRHLSLPVKGNVKIYEGGLVMLQTGLAIPGTSAAGLVTAGRAETFVDNTGGADGAKSITVKRGVFLFENDEASPVTNADLLKNCYVLDDETVTSDSTDASVAGKVLGFENGEVLVEIL